MYNAVLNYFADFSYIFGKMKNYEDLLGGIVRDESGHIIKATAIQNYWFLTVNFTSVDISKTGNMAGTATWV